LKCLFIIIIIIIIAVGDKHDAVHSPEAGVELDDASREQRSVATILGAARLLLLQLTHVLLVTDKTTQH